MHGKERHPVLAKHLLMVTQLTGHTLIISRSLKAHALIRRGQGRTPIGKLQVGAPIAGHFGGREPCLLGWMPTGRIITQSNVWLSV
jgi:hypothetical protein